MHAFSILNKALATISKQERQTIYNNWVSIRFEQGFDYQLLIQVVIVGGVLFGNVQKVGRIDIFHDTAGTDNFFGHFLADNKPRFGQEMRFLSLELPESDKITFL